MKLLGTCAALALAVGATPASAATYVYNGTGGALPDLVTFTSTIAVPDNFIVRDVNFTLNNLTHSFWEDLQITLSHGGISVLVAQDNGGSSNPDGDFTLDDEAATSIVNVNTTGGAFRPLNPLSAFDGGSALGPWQLQIVDQYDGDSGSLGSWTLTLTGNVEGAVPEPSTWALLILGFGSVGAAMRRRRTTTTLSYA